MTATTSLRALLETGEQIWAPCIYDCLSARTVELTGYRALMLSSAELAWSMCGIPDGLLSADEVIWAVTRIAASSPLPLVVDGENGGGTPLTVYRTVSRLVASGASGVTIEDTTGHWMAGYKARQGAIMPADQWAANIRAAVDAARGTDCVVIARTECKGGGAPEVQFSEDAKLGLDEAIRRCHLGLDASADMTLIMDINHADAMDEAYEVSRRVPGWKMYPDIKAGVTGRPDADLDELARLGFNFVTSHAAMKGATKGMLDYHRRNFENRDTVYSENDDFGIGLTIHPYTFEDWIGRARDLDAYREEVRSGARAAGEAPA
jgi:2-methylisocitrate lyase-like PEP mutase family enzyme